MPQTNDRLEAVQQSVVVDCPIEDTFELFTKAFGDWWPAALYSHSGEDVDTCVMEPWLDGRVFERTRSGEEVLWGSILEWDPPQHLRFSWNLSGRDQDDREIVDVRFDVDADGTKVTVVHSGWELSGVAVNAIQMQGAAMWPAVLTQFFLRFVGEHALVMV